MAEVGQKPDYDLVLKHRDRHNPERALIGKAWIHDGGHISVDVNPGTILSSELLDTFWLTLWPIKATRRRKATPKKKASSRSRGRE